MENESLRGVGVAEPIWWKIKVLEGWAQRSQYGEKSKLQREGRSGANILKNQSLRGVDVAEPMSWKIKAPDGWE